MASELEAERADAAIAPRPMRRATLGQRLCECIALCDNHPSAEEIEQAERELRAFEHRNDAQPELPL